MQLSDNTILITGGSSGLGLEMARTFAPNNHIIICGRSPDKLKKAKQEIPSLEYRQCDLSDPEQCKELALWIREHYPACNILINNAAIVHREPFYEDDDALIKADYELQTNLMGPIRLAKHLLPVIEQNSNPAIINVTTGLIYVPRTLYTYYNATKAALHSFTQVLRDQLQHTPIGIYEVMFPVVDTPWHDGAAPDIAITPEAAVKQMINGLRKDKKEIRVGMVKLLYLICRIAPGLAFKIINRISNK